MARAAVHKVLRWSFILIAPLSRLCCSCFHFVLPEGKRTIDSFAPAVRRYLVKRRSDDTTSHFVLPTKLPGVSILSWSRSSLVLSRPYCSTAEIISASSCEVSAFC